MSEKFLAPITIFLVGLVLLFLRNPDPVLNPTLFGEDAPWAAFLLRGDWGGAYLNARPDYLTLGQIILLHVAVLVTRAAYGHDLSVLPQAIAGLSYAFWAGSAALAYAALRSRIPVLWRLALSLVIILAPLGAHANEVIGRVLNLGYMFVPVTFFLLTIDAKGSRWRSLLVDAALLVCCATNPFCIVLVAAHAAWRILSWLRDRQWAFPYAELVKLALLCGFAVFLALRFASAPKVDLGPADLSHLVEAVTARSTLFPFVFSFYGNLNDLVAGSLWAGWLAVIGYALASSSGSDRLFGLACLGVTAFLTAAVLATRPGLTGHLTGYGLTFPDRYYYAQNIMAAVSLCWAISRFPCVAQSVAIVALSGAYVLGLPQLFDFARPAMPIATDGTFAEITRRAAENNPGLPADALVQVPAYPSGWTILIPAQDVYGTGR